MARLAAAFVSTFQGLATTEAQVDELWAGVVDRLLTQSEPERGKPTDADELVGAMVNLVTRRLVGQARGDILERLVGTKAN